VTQTNLGLADAFSRVSSRFETNGREGRATWRPDHPLTNTPLTFTQILQAGTRSLDFTLSYIIDRNARRAILVRLKRND